MIMTNISCSIKKSFNINIKCRNWKNVFYHLNNCKIFFVDFLSQFKKTFSLENIKQSESKTRFHFEIENYFKNFVFSVENDENFLELWKKINKKYSIIVQITKNIFSIFTSDIDVEWFFNTARDVCHYCQNCLNADIIEIIMLLK